MRLTVVRYRPANCYWRSVCRERAGMIARPMVAILTIALMVATQGASWASSDSRADVWASQGWPLLENFCVDCHSAEFQEAEVDLSLLQDMAGIVKHPELATHAINLIRFGAMPPEDALLPNDDERRKLADLLDEIVFSATCDLRPKPGRITARRLNRVEYNHAIRDIFGVDLRPADIFPSDEVGGGFDNNADVLSVSPMLMDKYLDAAEQVAQDLLLDPDTLPVIERTFAGTHLNILGDFKIGRFGEQYFASDSLAWIEFETPADGHYQLTIRGSSSTPIDPDNDNRSSGVDRKDFETRTAITDQDGRLLGIADFRYRGRSGRSSTDQMWIKLSAGKHRLFVIPTTELRSDTDGDSKEAAKWQVGDSIWPQVAEWSEDDILSSVRPDNVSLEPDDELELEKHPTKISQVIIKGPRVDDRGDLPESHQRLVRRRPSSRGDGFARQYSNLANAARDTLEPLMRRAFRRSITKDEMEPYVGLVAEATERGGSFTVGLQNAITAMLVSPQFLFRVEQPSERDIKAAFKEAAPGSDVAVKLTPSQLVSRWSFFLWSSVPDEELLRLADRDELRKRDQRQWQIKRMLADPKSQSLADHFAKQWFGLGGL
ncbi:MAG: DUF1587 domain-containing protein, partial [Planctomycetota bacterium]